MEEYNDLDVILDMQINGPEHLDGLFKSIESKMSTDSEMKNKILLYEKMYISEEELFENGISEYVDYLKNNESCLWIYLSEILSKIEILTYIEKFISHINKTNYNETDRFILITKLLETKNVQKLLSEADNENNEKDNTENNENKYKIWELLIGNLLNHINVASQNWRTNISKLQILIKKLIKSDKLIKCNFINWIAKITNVCITKINLSSINYDPSLPTDYYLANILGMMLTFWKEGINDDRIKFLDYDYIISDNCPIKWFDIKITNCTKNYNFLTECLFIILNLLRVGYYPILYRSLKWPTLLNEIDKQLNSFLTQNNPFITFMLNGIYTQKQIVKDHIDIDTEIINNSTLETWINSFYTQIVLWINNNKDKQFDDILVDMSYILSNINKNNEKNESVMSVKFNYDIDMCELALRVINSKTLTNNINTRCEFMKFFANVCTKTICNIPNKSLELDMMNKFLTAIIILHNDLHSASLRPDYKYGKKISIHQTIKNMYIINPQMKNGLIQQFSNDQTLTKKFVNILLMDMCDFNEALTHYYDKLNTSENDQDKENMKKHICSITNMYIELIQYLNALIKIFTMDSSLIQIIISAEIMTNLAIVLNTSINMLSTNFKYTKTLGMDNMDENDEDMDDEQYKLPDIQNYVNTIATIFTSMYSNNCDFTIIVDEYSFDINKYMEFNKNTNKFSDILDELENKIIEINKLNSLELLDAPSEFTDPIMCTPIETPCLLPGMIECSEGDIYFDKSTIMKHLLVSETNPYTRQILTIDEFEKFNNQIDIIKKNKQFREKFNEWKKANFNL